MDDALNHGRINVESLRRELTGLPLPLPRAADGRLVPAVDVSPWLRPEGKCSPQHDQALPIIEGTVIRLTVEHLPSRGEPKPLRLWWSKVDATTGTSRNATEPSDRRCAQVRASAAPRLGSRRGGC
jgi:hypothetical protein